MIHDLKGSDFVQKVGYLQADKRSFYLSPNRWSESKVKIPLDWVEVKFESGNENNVPQKKGIYAFIVKHTNNHFPPHGYIMYVGITGDVSADRTLKKRFKDYLYEQKQNKRPKVHFMLTKYSDNLYFNYVVIEDNSSVNLRQIEIDLNDALIPPVGRNDFSAEVKALRDAL